MTRKTVTVPEAVPEAEPPYSGPVYPVTLPASLGGGVIKMQKFTTRDFLGIRGRQWGDVEVAQRTIAAIIEYLPDQDPLDLALEELFELTAAWVAVRFDTALPPATA